MCPKNAKFARVGAGRLPPEAVEDGLALVAAEPFDPQNEQDGAGTPAASASFLDRRDFECMLGM